MEEELDSGARRASAPGLASGGAQPPSLLVAIQALLRAGARADILRVLADAAVSQVGADGAALIEVSADGSGQLVEGRSLPAKIHRLAAAQRVDATIGRRLLAAGESRFVEERTLLLTADARTFGALVLFFVRPTPGVRALLLAQTLVDIAASELDEERQRAALRRSDADLHASREALERTARLRALGEMSAGISHDLVNILNPLSIHLQLLRRLIKRGAPGAEEAIAEIESALRRGVETVARLRDFSRQAPEAPIEVVALDSIAHEAIELSRPRILSKQRAHAILIVASPGAPPPVRARASEVMAALLNLLVNAVDAMDDGGTITVGTGVGDIGAWVQVADDGPGIPAELQKRIFEPFFTTKGAAGTGLGLAMVYACVQRYGGTLTLDSAPGRGTCFTLWFPCDQVPSDDAGPAGPPASTARVGDWAAVDAAMQAPAVEAE